CRQQARSSDRAKEGAPRSLARARQLGRARLRTPGVKSMTASRIIWAAALSAVLLLSAPACTPAGRGTAKAQPAGLRAFASEAELRDFLRRRAKRARRADEGAVLSAPMSTASADAAAAPPPAQAAGEPGVTNVQEAGVDEGDIVKARGDLLVILRRGRVFTISIAGGGMRPVDHIDAF